MVIPGLIAGAEPRTLQFHCNVSGAGASGVETNIDTNGDGASATLSEAVDICSFGKLFLGTNACRPR